MFNISGLDQLTRQVEQAQQAFAEIDGELGTVNFEPSVFVFKALKSLGPRLRGDDDNCSGLP